MSTIKRAIAPATPMLLALILMTCTTAELPPRDEIGYLLTVLDATDCTFIRNEVPYSSDEFLFHLQSKMQRNIELIDTAEDFIELIATRSAESDIPYVAVCDGELVITRDWFSDSLASFRADG